ncbi:hypothetical protein BH09VER1_BH09VER1_51790 [soil metagenome]
MRPFQLNYPNEMKNTLFTPGRQRRNGFTLCEVVIAMGIFTVAATSILALVPSVLSSCRDSLERSVATQIADGIASQYANEGFAAATNAQLRFDDDGKQVTATGTAGMYTADVRVDKVPGENGGPEFSENLQKITVEVASIRSQHQSHRIFSYFQANQGF